ncbi:MAG: DMT family transporter [Stappiaceae bacterium]
MSIPSKGTSSFFRRTGAVQGSLVGCLWTILASLLFTVMVALIKELGQNLHVAQIIFIRQMIMMLVAAPILFHSLPHSLHTNYPGLHALRIILASTAMLAGFTAVVHLPIAEATAIGFSRSFFITLLAIFFLGEVVGKHRWAATIIGFIGIIIILRPTGEGALTYYGLLSVLAAACAAAVTITVRKLGQHESATTILSYQATFVGLVMLGPTIWYWTTPTFMEVGLLLATGLVSWAGQMSNIKAQQNGEANVLASLDYIRLLFAGFIGWYFFSEVLDIPTLIGSAIIICAALYTLRREARLRRQTTPMDGP